MKKLINIFAIILLLGSCSPKFTELNDHGFGGGISNKEFNEKKLTKIYSKSDHQPNNNLVYETAIENLISKDSFQEIQYENKKPLSRNTKLAKVKSQKISIFNQSVKALFRPLNKVKQNELSFIDRNSSAGKLVLLILGILSVILGLSIYAKYNVVYQAGFFNTVNTAFATFMRTLGLVVVVLGIIMLIVGLLME